MWAGIDSLLQRAPHVDALRRHRLELFEARRRQAAGLPLGELAEDVSSAVTTELAVPALLHQARAAYGGPLVVVKGPEVALDYPGPRLRRFRDLDILTDDPEAAQAALLRAGFVEVGEPELYLGHPSPAAALVAGAAARDRAALAAEVAGAAARAAARPSCWRPPCPGAWASKACRRCRPSITRCSSPHIPGRTSHWRGSGICSTCSPSRSERIWPRSTRWPARGGARGCGGRR